MDAALDTLLSIALIIGVPLALRTPPEPDGRGAGGMWFARTLAIPASIVVALALRAPAGIGAVLLTLPWLVAAAVAAAATAVRFTQDGDRLRPGVRHAEHVAVMFWLVGASAAVVDRLGIALFGFDLLTIRLTVVHFHVAGVILVMAGAAAWRRHPARWLELALGTLVIGVVVTAIGFMSLPLVNWIGAMLVVAGALGIGVAHLRIAVRDHDVPAHARFLLGVAGVALLVSMPLAAAYATARAFGFAGPGIAWMIAVHGTVNVLGFAVPAMLAWWQIRRAAIARAVDAPQDPRRLGRIGAVLALVCAGVATVVIAARAEPGPPGPIPDWLVIGMFVAVPGIVAAIAVHRGIDALLPVAGVMCLLQAFVAFSGVLFQFIVPAALLLAAAGGVRTRLRPSDAFAGGVVLIAWLGAWAARLGQVEERCWPVASGVTCSSGVPTSAGSAAAISLVVVALMVAAFAPASGATGHA